MTMKLRDDILALLKVTQEHLSKQGIPHSDSAIGVAAVNDRSFVSIMKSWDGGKKGPTMSRVGRLEQFLRDQIGPEAYAAFIRERAEKVLGE